MNLANEERIAKYFNQSRGKTKDQDIENELRKNEGENAKLKSENDDLKLKNQDLTRVCQNLRERDNFLEELKRTK